MQEEIWKDIPNYEGLYQISNYGRVKSIPRTYKKRKIDKEIIKKLKTMPNGYIRVSLSKNGKTKDYYVHRLVAKAYIPNIDNKPCINHKDCNRNNNNANNLEWVTHKENNSYKDHNLRKNISSVIYYLKRDYCNEKELINIAQKLKEKIVNL